MRERETLRDERFERERLREFERVHQNAIDHGNTVSLQDSSKSVKQFKSVRESSRTAPQPGVCEGGTSRCPGDRLQRHDADECVPVSPGYPLRQSVRLRWPGNASAVSSLVWMVQ
jgi:hypothetical protein